VTTQPESAQREIAVDTSDKVTVALLFGGRSAEHEVSLLSARYVFEALHASGYNVLPLAIGTDGRWRLCGGNGIPDRAPTAGTEVTFAPGLGGQLFTLRPDSPPLPVPNVDVVFPVLHGPFGEDGTVQGLLEVADVPYVGAGVLGSAVAMDKDVAKRLLREAGLPIPRYLACTPATTPDFATARAALGDVVFVKPARLGSSVGVSKADSAEAFSAALALAFRYDDKVLVEEFVDAREIECAVLETASGAVASVPGEIVPAAARHGFYSYEAKYLDDAGAELVLPANLPGPVADRVRALALQVFATLDLNGMARIDFFLKRAGDDILVNEANTIPGFTSISMYPKLMAASGVPGPELAKCLVDRAFAHWRRKHAMASSR
jgi:D-alanine-D-alanine ligase